MQGLKNVTVIAPTSNNIEKTVEVLIDCANKLPFNSFKLITHEKPINLDSRIQFCYCEKLDSYKRYNEFVFNGLYDYIQTSHCLLVQYDSGIIRPELWDDSWLNFDYIGAPWSYSNESYIADNGEHARVGNGGLSLRSKRLLGWPKQFNIPFTHERGYYHEDGNVCCYNRSKFLELGCKYAPIEVAAKFSFEVNVPENQNVLNFAWHGRKR